MTYYEMTDHIAALVFKHLRQSDARQAQSSHKLARAIAVEIVEDRARIDRVVAGQ